jgi:hypothetical protein
MYKLPRFSAMLLLAVGFAACGDLPTGREEQISTEGVTPNAAITLEPVIVIAPPCDPYTTLRGCEGGGDCMTSTAEPVDALAPEGCGSGGGSGGGTGGSTGGTGGGGGGSGSSGSGSVPTAPDDYDPGMTPPDCTKPMLLPWEHAYCTSSCTSSPPSGERLVRTLTALQRIAARGGECANIAAFAQNLLASDQIRYYDYVESIHGEYGGWGSPEIGAILDTGWVDDFGGTAAGASNFDLKLIHEVEHAMGRDHVPGSTIHTPNSNACSGF